MNDEIGTHQAGQLLAPLQEYGMGLAKCGKIEAHKQTGVWLLSRYSVLQYKERSVKQGKRRQVALNENLKNHPQLIDFVLLLSYCPLKRPSV